MAKHILTLALAALVVFATWAQPSATDERNNYALRGTSVKEATAAAHLAATQPPVSTIGEFYPNPTSNQGSILLNTAGSGKITFYNLLGTPVATQEFTKEMRLLSVDFSAFAEGVYFGIVTSGGKTIGTRRISIRR